MRILISAMLALSLAMPVQAHADSGSIPEMAGERYNHNVQLTVEVGNQTVDELKILKLEKQRAHMDSGDPVRIAGVFFDQLKEQAAILVHCGRPDATATVLEHAAEFAAWARPGLYNYLSGERAAFSKRLLSGFDLTQSVARMKVLQAGCDKSIKGVVDNMIFDQLAVELSRWYETDPKPL